MALELSVFGDGDLVDDELVDEPEESLRSSKRDEDWENEVDDELDDADEDSWPRACFFSPECPLPDLVGFSSVLIAIKIAAGSTVELDVADTMPPLYIIEEDWVSWIVADADADINAFGLTTDWCRMRSNSKPNSSLSFICEGVVKQSPNGLYDIFTCECCIWRLLGDDDDEEVVFFSLSSITSALVDESWRWAAEELDLMDDREMKKRTKNVVHCI